MNLLQYYDKILNIDPSNVNALNNKAIALEESKKIWWIYYNTMTKS